MNGEGVGERQLLGVGSSDIAVEDLLFDMRCGFDVGQVLFKDVGLGRSGVGTISGLLDRDLEIYY